MDDIQKTDQVISDNEEHVKTIDDQSIAIPSACDQMIEIGYLKKRLKRIEILNYLIAVLLVAVLAFNIIMAVNPLGANQVKNAKKLPGSLNKAVANQIINDIKDAYNSGDKMRLYNVLGEFAKTLVTVEEFEKSLEQVRVVGNLNDAYYTHYEYVGYKDGADIFVLNYVAKYELGNGSATVTVRSNDDKWEIIGFRFNSNS